MNSLLKISLFSTVFFLLITCFTSCGDEENEEDYIKTGPAAQVAGEYIGTLVIENEETEEVLLKVSANTPNQISLEFIGNGLPSAQKDVYLILNEKDDNIINESSNSLNLYVTINYNRSQEKLTYRLFDKPVTNKERTRIFQFIGNKQ